MDKTTKTENRGGAREGAGRKGLGNTKRVSICLTDELVPVFKQLGGAKWLRCELERVAEPARTLQTNNAANIFDSLGSQGQTALSTVSLQAVLPEETKTALTDLFRHYVPGSVAQSLIDHATFTGGRVIVTGVNLTTTQRDDLVQAFKAKFFLPSAQQETALPSPNSQNIAPGFFHFEKNLS